MEKCFHRNTTLDKICKHILKFSNVQRVENNQLKLAANIVWYLKLLQTWYTGKNPIKCKLLFGMVFIYANILLVGLWGHVFKYYQNPRDTTIVYNDIAVDLALITIGSSCYQYCLYFFKHRRHCARLLSAMGNFRCYEKPSGIELRDAVMCSIFRCMLASMGILAPLFVAYLIIQSCAEDDFICGLMYPAYIPGAMGPILRKIFLLIQLTSALTFFMLGFVTNWFGLQMSEYLVCYLQHFKRMLKEVRFIDDWTKRRMRIVYVIRYHQRILYLYGKFHEIARGLFLVHAITTPVIIALLMQAIILNAQISCYVVFAEWCVYLFILCYIGQRMKNECEDIERIVYDAIPLDGDGFSAKLLSIMVLRNQRTLCIPAGPLMNCGFELFLSVVKATYSYLAVIQNINARK